MYSQVSSPAQRWAFYRALKAKSRKLRKRMPGTIKLWKTGLESTAVQKMTFQGMGNLEATESGKKRKCKPTKSIRKREEQKISAKKGYDARNLIYKSKN